MGEGKEKGQEAQMHLLSFPCASFVSRGSSKPSPSVKHTPSPSLTG